MSVLLVFLIGGLLTFAIRFSFIYLLGRGSLPANVRHRLRFVPAAVLSAIVSPELLLHSGGLDLTLQNTRLLAGVLALVVAWRTKNVLLTILVGMGSLMVMQLFF